MKHGQAKNKITSWDVLYFAPRLVMALLVVALFLTMPLKTASSPLSDESKVPPNAQSRPLAHLQEINADNWDATIRDVVPERSLIAFLCFEDECEGELDDKQELFAQNKDRVLLAYIKLRGKLDGFLLELFEGPLTDGHMLAISPEENTIYTLPGHVKPEVFMLFVECVRNGDCESRIKKRNKTEEPKASGDEKDAPSGDRPDDHKKRKEELLQ